MTVNIDLRNAHGATRRRPVRPAEPTVPGAAEARFPRFAAAMAAARAANAPHLALHRDLPAQDIPPMFSHNPPRPRAAQWRAARAPRHPVARWLGIGGGVLLSGWLLVTPLTQPIQAEIERLISPWLEWRQDRQVAAPQTERAPPILPEPAAGRDDPPSEAMPVLASDDYRAAARPGPAAPTGEAAAPPADDPTARSVPVPSLKPPLPDR